MKMTALLLTVVFSSLTTLASVLPTEKKVEINEPKFARLIYKAYLREADRLADGSIQFSNLFRCSKSKCVLNEGQWLQSDEASSMAQALLTPKEDSAVFDLTEYMRVKPALSNEDGVTMATKEISVTVNGKYYGLTCVTATENESQKTLMSQCTLLNGIQN